MKKTCSQNKILLFFICFNLFCNGVFSADNNIQSELIYAKNLLDQKKYNEALNILQKLDIKHPQNHEIHYMLGQVYQENDNLNKALYEFKIAYELSTNLKTVQKDIPVVSQQEKDYIDLAKVYLLSSNKETALEYFNYAFELNPKNSEAVFNIAKIYFQTGKYEQAGLFIKKATLLNNNNKEYLKLSEKIKEKLNLTVVSNKIDFNEHYYNKMGIEYFNSKNYEKAEEYFQKAIELNPDYPQSYNNIANAIYNQGRYTQAISILEELIKTHPDYSDAYINIALIYRKNKDHKKELKYLNEAIKANPDSYKAYYQRANALLNSGKIKAAKNDLKTTLSINPNSAETLFTLGKIYFNENDHQNALENFSKIIDIDCKNDEAFYYLSLIAKNSNKLNLSIEHLKNAILINKKDLYIEKLAQNYLLLEKYVKCLNLIDSVNISNNENIENYKAIAYFKLKKLNFAQKSYKKLIALNPDRPIYHYNYSKCLQALKNYDKASEEFKLAISIKPSKVQDYIDIAKIYTEQKMNDYLKGILKEGIKKYPDNYFLNIKLARYYENQGDFKRAKKIYDKFNKNSLNNNVKKS